MKAKVNKEECIGCGLCSDICPAVFKMGDDSIAIVIVEEIDAKDLDAAKDAADQCPTTAITIE
jgi:ferredoxin